MHEQIKKKHNFTVEQLHRWGPGGTRFKNSEIVNILHAWNFLVYSCCKPRYIKTPKLWWTEYSINSTGHVNQHTLLALELTGEGGRFLIKWYFLLYMPEWTHACTMTGLQTLTVPAESYRLLRFKHPLLSIVAGSLANGQTKRSNWCVYLNSSRKLKKIKKYEPQYSLPRSESTEFDVKGVRRRCVRRQSDVYCVTPTRQKMALLLQLRHVSTNYN